MTATVRINFPFADSASGLRAASDIAANLRASRPGTEVKVFDDFEAASALTGASFG